MPSLPSKPRRAEDTRLERGAVAGPGDLQIGDGLPELHVVSDPMLLGGQWFVLCSCGWNSYGDDRPTWAAGRECPFADAEVVTVRNRARLQRAVARQQAG